MCSINWPIIIKMHLGCLGVWSSVMMCSINWPIAIKMHLGCLGAYEQAKIFFSFKGNWCQALIFPPGQE